MAQKETCLLTTPSRYHDIEKAEELMEEGKVKARFRLRRRYLRSGPIGDASDTLRLQEQTTVRIKGCGFRWVDCNFGCGLAVGHVDGSGAVLAS